MRKINKFAAIAGVLLVSTVVGAGVGFFFAGLTVAACVALGFPVLGVVFCATSIGILTALFGGYVAYEKISPYVLSPDEEYYVCEFEVMPPLDKKKNASNNDNPTPKALRQREGELRDRNEQLGNFLFKFLPTKIKSKTHQDRWHWKLTRQKLGSEDAPIITIPPEAAIEVYAAIKGKSPEAAATKSSFNLILDLLETRQRILNKKTDGYTRNNQTIFTCLSASIKGLFEWGAYFFPKRKTMRGDETTAAAGSIQGNEKPSTYADVPPVISSETDQTPLLVDIETQQSSTAY